MTTTPNQALVSSLIGTVAHIRACDAYRNLRGDADVIEEAIAALREQQPSEGDMARALHWLRQHDAPAEHLSALEEAVAGYVEPKVETVRREQQPAGDGGRHVVALREMRDTGDVSDWQAMESALDAAIAALTAAGRGGEDELLRFVRDFLTEYEECEDGDWSQTWRELGERARGLIAAPQQPPPVGVTDATRAEAKRIADHLRSAAEFSPDTYLASAVRVLDEVSHQQAAPVLYGVDYASGPDETVEAEWPTSESNRAAGAPSAQQPLDEPANNTGVATGSRNGSPSESVTRGNLPPTNRSPA